MSWTRLWLLRDSGARFLRVVSVADGLTQTWLQLHAVHDDLLRMHGLDRIQRHDEVPCILDVDHQLRSAVRCDLTHRAAHLVTVGHKYLISYRDFFSHDVALRSSCSLTWPAYPSLWTAHSYSCEVHTALSASTACATSDVLAIPG